MLGDYWPSLVRRCHGMDLAAESGFVQPEAIFDENDLVNVIIE